MIQVSGIDYEMYYVNNPIWVEIYNLTGFSKVDIEFTDYYNPNETYLITLDVFNDRALLNLASVGKSMMALPRLDQIYDGAGLQNNRKAVNLNFMAYNVGDDEPTLFKTKVITFVRGGFPFGNNIHLQDGAELIESEKVPVWNGLPSMYAEIVGTEIMQVGMPPNNKMDLRKPIGCDSVYLGWLNSKGGYSFWLFENWQMKLKSDKQDTLDYYRQSYEGQNFQTLGASSNYSLTVETRAERQYYNHFLSLVNSPDVWIFQPEKIIGWYGNINSVMPPVNGLTWRRINNNGNSFDWNGYEDVQDLSLNFDFVNTENRQVIW